MSEAANGPESTAERVALWRSLHVELDEAPYVLEDVVGIRLVDPPADWRQRPDMDPVGTRGFRASVVARARTVEDHVAECIVRGIDQYVILGAGLDTFVQRRPDLGARCRVFELDRAAPQEWKRRRLLEAGYGVPDSLRLVPVDFESRESWWNGLRAAGFDAHRPAVVASTGVSMYLTQEANMATLHEIATLAPGSMFLSTFMLPFDTIDVDDRAAAESSKSSAKSSGTPFISFYTPAQMLEMAREAGFGEATHLPHEQVLAQYFEGRPDGLRPSSGEEFLIART